MPVDGLSLLEKVKHAHTHTHTERERERESGEGGREKTQELAMQKPNKESYRRKDSDQIVPSVLS